VAALLIPFLSLPGTTLGVWTQELPVIHVLRAAAQPESFFGFPLWQSLFIVGATLSFGYAIYRIVKAARHPHATRLSDFRGIPVYELPKGKASFTFLRRIYLRKGLQHEARSILLHEYAHASQWHSLDLIVCTLYRAIFWMNPFILLWERRMRENHEFIADQYVLSHQIAAKDYAHVLLHATFDLPSPALAHGFEGKSMLRKRIENLTHKNQHHMKHLLIVPALAGLSFLAISMNAPETKSAVDRTQMQATTPDKPAEFKGGMDALAQFLGSETNYPAAAKEKGHTGMVFVSFEITETGKVTDASLAKTSGHSDLDQEALRVIQAMPDWNPAVSKGKNVRSVLTLPIKFAL
jgi:TonB family protein